jgi:hypothetical protein
MRKSAMPNSADIAVSAMGRSKQLIVFVKFDV